MQSERLQRAMAAIDARNADDPNTILVKGVERKKEQAHAEMVTEWIGRLRPDASEALQLAGRAHHVRRWSIARSQYPDGRTGYLQWRRALQDVHARELRAVMESEGYDAETVARAEQIVRKRELARDADVQALEDALCLVFLETQFEELAERLDEEKMIDVLRKTMKKMSPRGIELAASLPLAEASAALLKKAAGSLPG